MNQIPFVKMHGAGNDYVYVDCFSNPMPENPAELSIEMSDRHKGIGADGLILICPSDKADAEMRMFNADGSESEMCGNGIRCVGKYLFDEKIVDRKEFVVETGAGNLRLQIESDNGKAHGVRVNMGQPILDGPSIPSTFGDESVIGKTLLVDGREFEINLVSMGNPHCVIFVDEATDELVHQWGPKIENHSAFPNRTNVEFVEVHSKEFCKQRTWERGSGETQACGTGASAVCVAGFLSGRTERKIEIELLGGNLIMDWNETENSVYKTGPAAEVFRGNWPSP